jgi:hypothetical protein
MDFDIELKLLSIIDETENHPEHWPNLVAGTVARCYHSAYRSDELMLIGIQLMQRQLREHETLYPMLLEMERSLKTRWEMWNTHLDLVKQLMDDQEEEGV